MPASILRIQWLVGLLGALGCAGPLRSEQPTLPQDPSTRDSEHAPRRPDAVVVEPLPAIPSPTERADARGVVALREALGGDAVRDLVIAVMDAWRRESLDELAALLTSDAGPIESRSRGRTALVDTWRQRLHAHEYRRLTGVDLVRIDRIERYGWEDLSLPDSPARPPDMQPEELYVRVPVEVTRVAGERLFGDVIAILLRREDGKYKISAYGEAEAR